MRKPTLLLFDLGGVLIENATFKRLKELSSFPGNDDELKKLWLQSPAVRDFELGRCSPEEFAASFISEWGLQLSPQAFLDEFYRWPSGYYPEARTTLQSLRQRYRVACLSNSNCLHWEKFNGFKAEFDIALSSHQLGVIKPDKDAFLKALDICCSTPGKTYFFDDSTANVDAARSLGLRAFHVEGFDRLFEILAEEQLI